MNNVQRFILIKRTSRRCIRYFSERRRKFPINSEETKQLPVFQYNVSKNEYRRVFAWGNIHTGALAIPFIRKNKSMEHVVGITFPKRIGFGERYEVTRATCGFGFTVFAVNSNDNFKIYGTGINTDSQIGYHDVRHDKPLEILYYPKPIYLPFKMPEKSKVLKLRAGRAHLVVLTDEGIFTLGNNAFGQCGRKIIPDEDYIMSNYINHIENIDGKQIIDIECGQDHSMAVTEDGCVYSCGWGADGQTGLGHYNNCSEFSKVKGEIESERITKLACRSDFVLALNDVGDVFGWGNSEYGQITLPGGDQQVHTPRHIKMLNKLGKVESIASGGSFCIAVNDCGRVFSWGYGLLGVGPKAQQSKGPIEIPQTLFGKNDFQPNIKVTNVVCGLYHAAAITNLGDIFIWGRNKNGCLGLGNEKDQYFPLKVAMGGFATQVYCGVDHTIAICKPFI